MGSQNSGSPQKQKRMPAGVKRSLQQAIALHKREHGNKDYDLVREREEFASWVGKAAGAAGKRQFFRLAEKVAKPLAKDRTRPHENRDINEAQFAWAEEQTQQANDRSNLPIQLTPAQVMLGGPAALAGFADLRAMLTNLPEDLERARQACMIDDPGGHNGKSATDPQTLLKVCKERREFVRTLADLLRSYTSIFASRQFGEAVTAFLLSEFKDEPERQTRVLAELVEIITRSGIAPKAA